MNVDGSRRQVAARFVVDADGTVGFDVGEHDATRPVVIDPTLTVSTYLGGSSDEQGMAACFLINALSFLVVIYTLMSLHVKHIPPTGSKPIWFR